MEYLIQLDFFLFYIIFFLAKFSVSVGCLKVEFNLFNHTCLQMHCGCTELDCGSFIVTSLVFKGCVA